MSKYLILLVDQLSQMSVWEKYLKQLLFLVEYQRYIYISFKTIIYQSTTNHYKY